MSLIDVNGKKQECMQNPFMHGIGNQLPTDIIFKIFSLVPVKELLTSTCQVCRLWQLQIGSLAIKELSFGQGLTLKISEISKTLRETSQFIAKRTKGDKEDNKLINLRQKASKNVKKALEIEGKIKKIEGIRQKQKEVVLEVIKVCVFLNAHALYPLKSIQPYLKYFCYRFVEEKMLVNEFIKEAFRLGDDEAIYEFALIQPDRELHSIILEYVVRAHDADSRRKLSEKIKSILSKKALQDPLFFK